MYQEFNAQGSLAAGDSAATSFDSSLAVTPGQSSFQKILAADFPIASSSKVEQGQSRKRSWSESHSRISPADSLAPRKRSGLFNIPDEITMENVDELIAEAKAAGDELLEGNLKLAKRVRRNRDAA